MSQAAEVKSLQTGRSSAATADYLQSPTEGNLVFAASKCSSLCFRTACKCWLELLSGVQAFSKLACFRNGGKVFVCICNRKNREASPWRDRPIAESLALFEDMRRGLVDEGKATLRYPSYLLLPPLPTLPFPSNLPLVLLPLRYITPLATFKANAFMCPQNIRVPLQPMHAPPHPPPTRHHLPLSDSYLCITRLRVYIT